MKFTYRYGMFVIAMVIFAIAVTVFSTGVGAQDEGWQVVRADYGFRTQRNDVTDILKDLMGRGGVNGRVAVTNQTIGGDPPRRWKRQDPAHLRQKQERRRARIQL